MAASRALLHGYWMLGIAMMASGAEVSRPISPEPPPRRRGRRVAPSPCGGGAAEAVPARPRSGRRCVVCVLLCVVCVCVWVCVLECRRARRAWMWGGRPPRRPFGENGYCMRRGAIAIVRVRAGGARLRSGGGHVESCLERLVRPLVLVRCACGLWRARERRAASVCGRCGWCRPVPCRALCRVETNGPADLTLVGCRGRVVSAVYRIAPYGMSLSAVGRAAA